MGPRGRALSLFSDRLGDPPVYVARSASALIVAGELKALVAAAVEPVPDLQAWAELLAYEHALGEHAPLAGVRLVPPATTLTLSAVGEERSRERWRYRVEPAPDGDERELVGEFARQLRKAVERRLDPGTVLALSGGLDSRCLITVVQDVAPKTAAVMWGVRGSEDFDLGAAIAERAACATDHFLSSPAGSGAVPPKRYGLPKGTSAASMRTTSRFAR